MTIDGGADATGSMRRTVTVLTLTVVLLVLGLVLRSTVITGEVDVWINVATIGLLAVLAYSASMSAAELGTQRRFVGSGLRWGGTAFAVIALLLVVASAIPATSGYFEDDRADIGAGELWLKVVVVIPIGTVLLEELAFRGMVLGLLRRLTTMTRAVTIAAVLFGLWHVLTAWTTSSGSSNAARVAAVAGTVVATTMAGFAFCYLRLRARSLVAPMLAHIATNSVTLAIAWFLARP